MRDPGSHDAVREVSIAAPPADVWEALADPAVLSAWFGADAELEPRTGAPLRFRFPDGSERRGLVEDVEPGRRLTWRWRELHGAGLDLVVGPPSTVTIELEPEGDGTRVRATEAGRPEVSRALAGATANR